jgi:DNA polymerase-4
MVCAHVDLDCFFVQVAQRIDPTLTTNPVAVLAKSAVVSASYEARAAGVRAGMASTLAQTLCPNIVFANVDRDAVAKASALVFSSLSDLAATHGWEIHQTGIDEAYVSAANWASLAPRLARWREECRTDPGYVCSVGVGPSRIIAKMASSAAKPDGFLPIAPERAVSWVTAQQVADVPGVGPRAWDRLRDLGVRTVGDVLRFDRARLTEELGAALTSLVEHTARAEDQSPRLSSHAALPSRSVSLSQTFNPAISFDGALRELDTMCGRLASRLFQQGAGASTLTVGVRTGQRVPTSRSVPAGGAFAASQLIELARAALVSLALDKDTSLRLLSVTCDVTTTQQPSLFPPAPEELFVPGAAVWHPVFGVGVVDSQMPEPNLVRVRFRDRTRDVLSSSLKHSSIS